MGKRGPKAKEFWSLVAVDEVGCWEWQGGRFANGYGRYHLDGKTYLAHRFIYERTHGPISSDAVVMHSCDNRICVRLDHLSVGTPADNMADMVAKGRSLAGERNHESKLNAQAVRDIRKALKRGETHAAIAQQHEVSEVAIWNVAHGRSWRSVE